MLDEKQISQNWDNLVLFILYFASRKLINCTNVSRYDFIVLIDAPKLEGKYSLKNFVM